MGFPGKFCTRGHPARPQLCIAADKGFERVRERLPVISQRLPVANDGEGSAHTSPLKV
jgi:hypothetical protein